MFYNWIWNLAINLHTRNSTTRPMLFLEGELGWTKTLKTKSDIQDRSKVTHHCRFLLSDWLRFVEEKTQKREVSTSNRIKWWKNFSLEKNKSERMEGVENGWECCESLNVRHILFYSKEHLQEHKEQKQKQQSRFEMQNLKDEGQ